MSTDAASLSLQLRSTRQQHLSPTSRTIRNRIFSFSVEYPARKLIYRLLTAAMTAWYDAYLREGWLIIIYKWAPITGSDNSEICYDSASLAWLWQLTQTLPVLSNSSAYIAFNRNRLRRRPSFLCWRCPLMNVKSSVKYYFCFDRRVDQFSHDDIGTRKQLRNWP